MRLLAACGLVLIGCAGTGAGAGSGAGAGGAGAGGSQAGSGGSTGIGAGSGGAAAGAGGGGSLTGGSAGLTAGASGTAGAGGTAGAAGTAGAPPTGPCGAAGLWLCDDFESLAAGAEPAAPNWRPQPTWQNDRIKVDSSKAHSGKNAISLMGANYGVQLLPAGDFAPTDNSFFVRAFLQVEKSTMDMGGHVDFIEGAEAENDSGEELRLGASHGIVDLNLIPGSKGTGASGEKTQYSNGDVDIPSSGAPGVVLMPGKWYCVEAHFNGKDHEFRLWLDNQEVAGLHVTDWKQGRKGWSPSYKFVKVGAQNFSGGTGRVWYDDIAIGGQRIGCGS